MSRLWSRAAPSCHNHFYLQGWLPKAKLPFRRKLEVLGIARSGPLHHGFFGFPMINILLLLWVPSACFLHCVSPFSARMGSIPMRDPTTWKTGDSPERRAPRFPRPIGQDPQLITGQISVQVGGEPPHAWCIPAGKSNGTTVTKARRFHLPL